jgi:Tfp pilus assembly protein FimT
MQSNIHDDSLCIRSKGVALVEVVVTLSLCGIIASFAVPRLTHLENDVRATEMVALSVNLRSAAMAAHDQYVESGARVSAATWKGRSVRLDHGYPDAGVGGIQSVVADVSEFAVSADATSVTYSKVGAPAAAECAVTYRAAPVPGEAPLTDVITRGC